MHATTRTRVEIIAEGAQCPNDSVEPVRPGGGGGICMMRRRPEIAGASVIARIVVLRGLEPRHSAMHRIWRCAEDNAADEHPHGVWKPHHVCVPGGSALVGACSKEALYAITLARERRTKNEQKLSVRTDGWRPGHRCTCIRSSPTELSRETDCVLSNAPTRY